MAAKKKVTKKTPRDATYEGLVALHTLLDAQDACTHMDKEMSPTARISWRERALVKVALANAMVNFLRMVKEK